MRAVQPPAPVRPTPPGVTTIPGTQPVPVEHCAQCAAPLAADQRYCLNCGAPRTYLSGASGSALMGASSAGAPPIPPSGRSAGQRDSLSITQILVGVAVLLLAMGVGVLIGRSSTSAPKQVASPVITVPQSSAATGAGAAATGSAATGGKGTSASSSAGSHEGASHPGSVKASIPKGTGESIEHPAPPSVIKKAHEASTGGGKSAEQASGELPNVVETGK